MNSEIEKARAILQATRHVQFNEHPAVDLRDRLGLLTVVVGLREVAAFGFAERGNENRLRALKDILDSHRLPTQITRQVCPPAHHQSMDIPGDFVEVFDRDQTKSYQRHSGRLLWICRKPKTREEIKRAVTGEIPAGTLLGYPKCCVEEDKREDSAVGQAFCKAMIGVTANDPQALELALRDNVQVRLALDPLFAKNAGPSEERFPFVQHIACPACLSSEDSPSARLNLKYEQLAREVDPDFHSTLMEMAKVAAGIGRIVDEAESKGLNKETLDRETDEQLQSLFRKQDRMFADFRARGKQALFGNGGRSVTSGLL